jgi:hypothetical protein
MTRSIQITVLALATMAVALMAATSASAKEPCWQTLIDDWYDGRIDNVYPVACYRAALEHQPEDVAQYSSLGDDINRALAYAIAHKSSGGGNGSPGNTGGQGGSGNASTATTTTSTFHGGPKAERGGAGVTASAGRDEGGGPVNQAIGSLGADSADSVPVPLIVLGSLAIVLLALGAAGFIARRLQTRRAAVRPVTKS